jgi:hypothetical protein
MTSKMFRMAAYGLRPHKCDFDKWFRPIRKIHERGAKMMVRESVKRLGRVSFGLAAMVLGLPLPFVILAFLCGGCDRW